MTFLLLTENAELGKTLAKLLKRLDADSLPIIMAPGDLRDSLQTIRVDCVVHPASMPCEAERALCPGPCFLPWTEESVTEDWARSLLHRAARRKTERNFV